MDYIAFYDSPLGRIMLSSDGESLTGLWFEGQKYFGAGLSGEREVRVLPVFEQTERWLDIYFSGHEPDGLPPILLRGTPFQKAVWALLREIPYGRTVTYGALADALAARSGRGRMSARAVGTAVGRNPVSIIVPCHRVIGKDGSLTGYAGGTERKDKLLRLEGIALPDMAGRKRTGAVCINSFNMHNSLDRAAFFPYNSKSEEGEQ